MKSLDDVFERIKNCKKFTSEDGILSPAAETVLFSSCQHADPSWQEMTRSHHPGISCCGQGIHIINQLDKNTEYW